ncbi:hypothetical protein QR680_003661 [Steinernema hermaphroditum]|uniref:Secreted protein n=1 Tax=Steinernema hermaphroditum TaxID=289476 RepID=A0AA39HL45_9BILA|nr:hypothetical protein QR680_003661 [Steinernema hermaphroditum]
MRLELLLVFFLLSSAVEGFAKGCRYLDFMNCLGYYKKDCNTEPFYSFPVQLDFDLWTSNYERLERLRPIEARCHSLGYLRRCVKNTHCTDRHIHDFKNMDECIVQANEDKHKASQLDKCTDKAINDRDPKTKRFNMRSFFQCFVDAYTGSCGENVVRYVCELLYPLLRRDENADLVDNCAQEMLSSLLMSL